MPSNNYCAYRECSSKGGRGISLFAFPKDRKRAEKWIHACNRADLLQKDVNILHNYHKLCEKHFEDKYLSKGTTRKTLIGGVVPTLFQCSSKIAEGSIIGSPCIMAIAVPNQIVHSDDTISSANVLFSVNNKVDEPLDEPEIKIEGLNNFDKATDPLELNEKPHDIQSNNTDIKTNPSLQPVLQNCPTLQSHNLPIILMTIATPSEQLFEQMKQQRLKTYIECDMSKVIPGPSVTVKNSTMQISVESGNQSNILHNTETVQEEIIEDVVDLENDQSNTNDGMSKNIKEVKKETLDVSEQEKDTSIEWKKCDSDVFDMDFPDPKKPHIKGNAILRENSIEFPNIRRQLKFGRDCPKLGHLKKFPYKLHKMTRTSRYGREVETIKPGHRIQIHTAIIVDDDDQAEKEAIEVISRIIMENAKLAQVRSSKSKTSVFKEGKT